MFAAAVPHPQPTSEEFSAHTFMYIQYIPGACSVAVSTPLACLSPTYCTAWYTLHRKQNTEHTAGFCMLLPSRPVLQHQCSPFKNLSNKLISEREEREGGRGKTLIASTRPNTSTERALDQRLDRRYLAFEGVPFPRPFSTCSRSTC